MRYLEVVNPKREGEIVCVVPKPNIVGDGAGPKALVVEAVVVDVTSNVRPK
jgi:hypothetical protein